MDYLSNRVASVALVLGLSATNAWANDTGNWRVSDSEDPMNDTKTTLAWVNSDTRGVSLNARCKNGRLTLHIDWDTYLGTSSNDYDVVVRLDKGKVVRHRWQRIAANNTASFFNNVKSFLKMVIVSKTLVTRLERTFSSSKTAIFDLTGADEALKPIFNRCGVK